MELTEKEIDYLEQFIPEWAEIATRRAYWQALASGYSVMISENGAIVEVFPDGTRKFIKAIEPRTPSIIGQIIKRNEQNSKD